MLDKLLFMFDVIASHFRACFKGVIQKLKLDLKLSDAIGTIAFGTRRRARKKERERTDTAAWWVYGPKGPPTA